MEKIYPSEGNYNIKKYLQRIIIVATTIFSTLWGTSCSNYSESYNTKDTTEDTNTECITSDDDLERIISWNEYIKD